MKLAFASKFDAQDVNKRSGTPYYMTQALEQSGIELNYLGPLTTHLPPGFKFKRFWQKLINKQHESARSNIFTVKQYSKQLSEKLAATKADAVIAHIMDPLAYLDTKIPSILWIDTTYASLMGFYPSMSHYSASAVEQVNIITREFFARTSLAIFSSEWAAQDALRLYGASKEKIKVVPFGANINCQHTLADIKQMIRARSRNVIRLLFIGKEWWRKGGDTVLAVAKALHASGQPVELTIVGCYPPAGEEIPHYVKCLGYLSKSTPEGNAKMAQLFRDTHFLFVPSRAEAYGVVFCEANAFGVPCLTSYVGGIPTIVKDNVNGMTFALDATTRVYCDYISNVMENYARYERMALASFNEFETRLNWQVAVKEVKRLIVDVL